MGQSQSCNRQDLFIYLNEAAASAIIRDTLVHFTTQIGDT